MTGNELSRRAVRCGLSSVPHEMFALPDLRGEATETTTAEKRSVTMKHISWHSSVHSLAFLVSRAGGNVYVTTILYIPGFMPILIYVVLAMWLAWSLYMYSYAHLAVPKNCGSIRVWRNSVGTRSVPIGHKIFLPSAWNTTINTTCKGIAHHESCYLRVFTLTECFLCAHLVLNHGLYDAKKF